MKRLPFFATALLGAWLTTASLHAAQLIQGPSTASVGVYDYTISNYNNKYSNDMDDQDLLDMDMADDLDTIAFKAKSELPLGAVVLSNQPLRKSKNNNNNDDKKEGDLTQTSNSSYQRYVFAASGLIDTKAHKIAHRFGYHIVQTEASHIVPALLQWLAKSQGKHIHRIAFTAPLCPKCHYLLTLVYTQGNVKSSDQGCAQKPLIWPLPSLAMRYLNGKIVQLGKPLEITQTILDKVLGISQERFTQLQKDNNNLKKQLNNKEKVFNNNDNNTHKLQQELNNKNMIIQTLQNDLTNNDNLINTLKNDLTNKEKALIKAQNTELLLAQTQEKLRKQTEEVNTLKNNLTNKEKALDNNSNAIHNLQQELNNKNTIIQTLQDDLTNNDNLIKTLKKDLTNKEKALDDKSMVIQTLQNDLKNK